MARKETLKEKIAIIEKASKKLKQAKANQSCLKVSIKKLHPDAVIPAYAHSTDAGMDLTAISKSFDDHGNAVYGFGLAFEIPKGYVGLIFPRSSNYKTGMLLTNAVGVIDSGYRGEVTAKFALKHNGIMPAKLWHRLKYLFTGLMKNGCGVNANYNAHGSYNVGDRVAQMIIMPYPKVKFQEVEELSETERGEGGYGSTGK